MAACAVWVVCPAERHSIVFLPNVLLTTIRVFAFPIRVVFLAEPQSFVVRQPTFWPQLEQLGFDFFFGGAGGSSTVLLMLLFSKLLVGPKLESSKLESSSLLTRGNSRSKGTRGRDISTRLKKMRIIFEWERQCLELLELLGVPAFFAVRPRTVVHFWLPHRTHSCTRK